MIRRKDSFGFIDLIRGKCSPLNTLRIKRCVDEMTLDEKERVLTVPFELLWRELWGEPIGSKTTQDELQARDTFNAIVMNGLNNVVANSKTAWTETEWEFPKGRRNTRERELECALREFEEETGISSTNIAVLDNVTPYEETYIGSNNKSYKHKYFVAKMVGDRVNLASFQRTEVSKLEWKTLEECKQSIRPYNIDKIRIITQVDAVLNSGELYCCI
jgi:8-oxo-dGTP pyrophosphatase MutT (NUDIX family)